MPFRHLCGLRKWPKLPKLPEKKMAKGLGKWPKLPVGQYYIQ